jgi:hypothetical protein
MKSPNRWLEAALANAAAGFLLVGYGYCVLQVAGLAA